MIPPIKPRTKYIAKPTNAAPIAPPIINVSTDPV